MLLVPSPVTLTRYFTGRAVVGLLAPKLNMRLKKFGSSRPANFGST